MFSVRSLFPFSFLFPLCNVQWWVHFCILQSSFVRPRLHQYLPCSSDAVRAGQCFCNIEPASCCKERSFLCGLLFPSLPNPQCTSGYWEQLMLSTLWHFFTYQQMKFGALQMKQCSCIFQNVFFISASVSWALCVVHILFTVKNSSLSPVSH